VSEHVNGNTSCAKFVYHQMNRDNNKVLRGGMVCREGRQALPRD
jgi:hypothetical protein